MTVAVFAVLFVHCIGNGGSGDGKVLSPTPRPPLAREESVIAAVLSAAGQDGGFTDLPASLSLGPDLRSTFFAVLALESSGGLSQGTKGRTVDWLLRFEDGEGWFRPDGALESVDVAILVNRLLLRLGESSRLAAVDAERLIAAASAELPTGQGAFQLSRLAWASRIIAGSDKGMSDAIAADVQARLTKLDGRDLPVAVAVAQLPDDWAIPPALRESAVDSLRNAVMAAASHPGPWNEYFLSLGLLGGWDDATVEKAYSLFESRGAPHYWGYIGAIDAYLLERISSLGGPPKWGPVDGWLADLREALLQRESPTGGFAAPVVAPGEVAATAAAVIALHLAGGDDVISARRDALGILCNQEIGASANPNLTAAIVREAKDVARLECRGVRPVPPETDRDIDRWLYAIGSGEHLSHTACPQKSSTPSEQHVLLLFSALALQPTVREGYLLQCGAEASLTVESAETVFDLYAVVALRLMLKLPVSEGEARARLEMFRLGGAYGSDGSPSMADTCQAMVLRDTLTSGQLNPVVCIV